MSHHEGVSCDSCLRGNFRGRRYKCLICFDFDQCSSCYESSTTSPRHTSDHPMQCILTRADYELFYGGEAAGAGTDQPQSYTCPFCARMGFTEMTLHEHVSSDHMDTSLEVICPVCASVPGGEPNNVTDDFLTHLTIEHRSPRELEESSSAGGNNNNGSSSNTAIRGRRAPHPSRSMHSSRSSRRNQMQYATSSVSGLAPLSSSDRSNLSSGQNYSSNGQLATGSSIGPSSSGVVGAVAGSLASSISSPRGEPSGGMDPIAELLSQLSGVRRATSGLGSHSAQLQQLQMQLQLERGNYAGASSGSIGHGAQLLATLHPSQGQPMAGSGGSNAAPSGHGSSMSASAAAQARSASLYSQVVQVAQAPIERVMRRHHQQQAQQQHLQAQMQAAGHGAIGTPGAPYALQSHLNGLSSSNSAAGHPLGSLPLGPGYPHGIPRELYMAGHPFSNYAGFGGPNNVTVGNNNPNTGSLNVSCSNESRFLLSRCDEVNQSESELAASEVMKSDKSLFIQELLIQTLSMDVESLELSGQRAVGDDVQSKESEMVKQASETSVINKASPSVPEVKMNHREKLISDQRLPSIEDEDETPVLVNSQVVTSNLNCQLSLVPEASNPTIVSVDPGPDENVDPVTATTVLSATSTFTASSCQAPVTSTTSGKLRSSQSVDTAASLTSPVPSTTTDPLAVLTTNFFTPSPVTHALVPGGASGGVSSRGTSPSPWSGNSASSVPSSRPGNVRRSNSSGASSSGPSHPVKRGPPPTIPSVVTNTNSGTGSVHRHES